MSTYMGVSSLNNARASAVLPAAGAWDAAPTEFFISGANWMAICLTYTAGEQAAGACDIQLELSQYSVAALVPAGANEWIEQTLYAPGAVASGADSQSLAQAEYITFMPVGAAAESITFAPVSLRGTFERARVRARESADGIVGTPGTAQITVNLSGFQPVGMGV